MESRNVIYIDSKNYETDEEYLAAVGRMVCTLIQNDYEIKVRNEGVTDFIALEFDWSSRSELGDRRLMWLTDSQADEVMGHEE